MIKYYGDITTKLQFLLVRRYVKRNWVLRRIYKQLGVMFCD
ncbi:hypothetical protein LCGC14_0862430 [marine sediment metagenome]|uniref:Uncharacterized protein n=1 Tax=marine sediment metagenome TaxID=412755 RepID=A0A0F9PBZ7_9ZZZZ